MKDWPNAYKSMALFGGALIVAASFFAQKGSMTTRAGGNKNRIKYLVVTGSIFLAAFL
jgi:hypothetical protein